MDSLDRAWRGLLHDRARLERWRKAVGAVEERVHAFLQFDPDLTRADSAAAGPLAGVPFAVKDNIAVSGFRLTCGSRLLKDLVSPYTATAVRRLQEAGAVVAGKTNLDEFGMGSSTENSALLQTANPWDLERVPGGSSGGSAAAVAAGMVPFALGSDTGGSVRQPAAFCGVYGLKPTYGAVSRYGLVAYASSLEVIGVVSRDVATARLVFETMRGADERDQSSVEPEAPPAPARAAARTVRGWWASPASAGRWPSTRTCRRPSRRPSAPWPGWATPWWTWSCPALQYAVAAYYVIATAEASANLARFDGVRYGQRAMEADTPEELVKRSRSRGLGDEVKLRILLGTYVLRSGFQEQYYGRAQRIRTAHPPGLRPGLRPRGPDPDAGLHPPALPARRGRAGPLRPEAGRHLHLRGQPGRPAGHELPGRRERRPAHRPAVPGPLLRGGAAVRGLRGFRAGVPASPPAAFRRGRRAGSRMFQSFIGLEVHIHLLTRTKVFCGCRAAFGDEPNTNVCPVCLGYPGVLPALNGEAMRMGYRVARALGCALSGKTVFERKNYFYPDLPKNYQISQFAAPLGRDGSMELELHRRHKRVRIKEVHLEEDAGKMIHAGDLSLLDFNRAGSPLLEIVTQPDLEVGEEAEVFLQHFRRLVRYLGVCDGNMEEGSLRCDANVSVNFTGQGLGDKVEIKNMNSFKFVRKALTYEIERQQEILERGGTVTQETRLWNENRDQTESMRRKEEAFDYRYFPEPDLPPFRPDAAFLEEVEGSLVELPRARRERLIREHGLAEHQADFVTEEKAVADFFEEAVAHGRRPAGGGHVAGRGRAEGAAPQRAEPGGRPLHAARFAELLTLLAARRIHGRIAKQVLDAVFAEDRSPLEIIRARGWEQITDRQALAGWVEQAVAAPPPGGAAGRRRRPQAPRLPGGRDHEAHRRDGRAGPAQGAAQRPAVRCPPSRCCPWAGPSAARHSAGGPIAAGDIGAAMRRLGRDPQLASRLRFEEIEIRRILSEEITPEDWAALIAALDAHLKKGSASGIVIAHGTDTLAYTASLLYWLFPRAGAAGGHHRLALRGGGRGPAARGGGGRRRGSSRASR